ncbi:MAG TPA: 30S ribosomal protein S12 methylthiotransferase RimO [Bacteroidales bacterium]|nr:30S ribosomal protein S12 methylthiotransferase RimO [Bacteroidales bacterium]
MNKKINIVTLGCSKNLVDSEKLLGQIRSGGYSIVHDSDDLSAAVVIINTCGFINDAREESIDTILRFVRAKEAGNIDHLYVMGCLAERYSDALRNEIPEVDRYFGVNDVNAILDEVGVQPDPKHRSDRVLTGPGHYAYLKVSEGCDRTCAFCSIPLIRGKCISRPVEDILAEAKDLSGSGVRELILIAQDLSYYGLDLYKKQMLPGLLRELIALNCFEWIRLHYLYPANFPEEILDIINDNHVICKYIDIPIQHISDSVLLKMKRSHDRAMTESLLYRIRERIPGAVIRTTLIAGHPGETEEDFEKLKRFVASFRFDRLGVFAYSHEEGTYAGENYDDDVAEEVKKRRMEELMAIQQDISLGKNSSMAGSVIRVLIDRREGGFFAGRTQFDSPEVDQEVLVPDSFQLVPGNFYDIKIEKAEEFDLFGYPVNI